MRNAGGLKTGLQQDAWKFEGSSRYQNSVGPDLPKSALEREDHVPRAECIDPINVAPHQGRSTHEGAPLLKGTHPYSCFEGDPTDKSRASPPVARRERARKHPLHGRENLHHLGAVQPPEQQDLCSNIPWGEGKYSEGTGRPSPFLHYGLVGGIPSGGDISLFLQDRGETGVRVYQEDVLQGVVKHLNMILFSGQEWVFQQDSVPDQKAKTNQAWLRRNLLAFISSENWLSESADLNPLDCKLWAVLADMACQKRHNSLESLRRSLVKAPAEISLETERAATAEWSESLKICVEAEGGHFEWHYYKWKPKTSANKLFGSKSGCFV